MCPGADTRPAPEPCARRVPAPDDDKAEDDGGGGGALLAYRITPERHQIAMRVADLVDDVKKATITSTAAGAKHQE